MLQHNLRLLDALSEHRFPAWPRAGPIAINETHPDRGWERLYLVDRWCHLGTTKDEEELWSPLESSRRNEINAIEFHPDVYKARCCGNIYLGRSDTTSRYCRNGHAWRAHKFSSCGYQYDTSIFVASRYITRAKIRFSVITGKRCAMRAPIGAVTILPATRAMSAGTKTKPRR